MTTLSKRLADLHIVFFWKCMATYIIFITFAFPCQNFSDKKTDT